MNDEVTIIFLQINKSFGKQWLVLAKFRLFENDVMLLRTGAAKRDMLLSLKSVFLSRLCNTNGIIKQYLHIKLGN